MCGSRRPSQTRTEHQRTFSSHLITNLRGGHYCLPLTQWQAESQRTVLADGLMDDKTTQLFSTPKSMQV